MELEDRFFEFCRTIPGAELIDELNERQLALLPEKRADLFFEQRTVVAEVKSLETDTASKIKPILAPHEETDDWPIFYGEWQIARILQHLPDGQSIANRIGKAVTSAIPDLVKKAHRQIRATKGALVRPASEGLLIVLNERIDVLSPKLLGEQVNAEINKKVEGGGGPRYPHLNMALVLAEAHVVQVGPIPAIPSLICTNWGSLPSSVLSNFVDELQRKWAEFNGGPAIQGRLETLLSAATRSNVKADPVTLGALWRRSYSAAPYLRGLSDEELFDWGATFLPNAVADEGHTVRAPDGPALEKFTHFLEEIAFRGVDLRKWGPELRRRLASDRPGNTTLRTDSAGRPLPSRVSVRANAFYRNPRLDTSVFCESVTDESATYVVLESQPRGARARVRQSLAFAYQYEEAVDSAEIERLRRILEDYLGRTSG